MRAILIGAAACLFAACGGGGDVGDACACEGGPIDGGPGVDAPMHDGGMTGTDLGTHDGGTTDMGGGPLATVHYIGRFDDSDPTAPSYGWPASAVSATFMGTGITATVDDWGMNTYDVDVDGAPAAPFTTSGGAHDHVLASGLTDGMHTVTFTRRTESFYGPTHFLGFPGATLVPSPGPTRFVEFIGDSITCGYGVLGAGPTCGFSPDTEAETHAWGALASGMLGAAHASVAYSGKGLYRNLDGSTADVMPQLYDRVIADDGASHWDFLGYTPDAVVVNLGTNDYGTGDPGSSYVDAGVTFVGELRAHWPGAWIVLASSPMLGDPDHASEVDELHMIATMSGDARVSVLDLPTQAASDGWGCDYHPSEATQMRMATALAGELRTRLGW